jgi:hypothetical protein
VLPGSHFTTWAIPLACSIPFLHYKRNHLLFHQSHVEVRLCKLSNSYPKCLEVIQMLEFFFFLILQYLHRLFQLSIPNPELWNAPKSETLSAGRMLSDHFRFGIFGLEMLNLCKFRLFIILIKTLNSWTPVIHAYSPSYLGGRDQEDHGSRPSWANSS